MILHLERKFTDKTETFIANQINALSHLDHIAFTIKNLGFLQSCAKVYSPPTLPGFLDLKFLSNKDLAYFRQQLKLVNIKLIHSHFLTDARFFYPLTKQLSVPKICSCYGYDVSQFPKKFGVLSKIYLSKVFDEYDLFLAMSADMAHDLINLGCPAEKIRIHYHGVNTSKYDLPRSYALDNGVMNLLSIGRLEPKKGFITALKALKNITEQHPNIKLKYIIVGDGSLFKSLSKYVSDNGLDDIVNFKGFIPQGAEFNKILSEAHIFILPSVTANNGNKEGIPGTIVEAMSSGLPVISTYHAGIPDVIENNVTGFLVNEYDHTEISKRITNFYYNEELRRSIGENAKKYANEKLDLFIKAIALENIYSDFINTNPYL